MKTAILSLATALTFSLTATARGAARMTEDQNWVSVLPHSVGKLGNYAADRIGGLDHGKAASCAAKF